MTYPQPGAQQVGKQSAAAAAVDVEGIYPEGGSAENDMEISANMVETIEGWLGDEQEFRVSVTSPLALQ